MFKLALTINLLLMYEAPPFEQTLITHKTICVQHLRILFSSFGEENFKSCIQFAMFKLSLAIIVQIM